ncbi:MAG: hypothetical protein ACFFBP_24125 [Promethearchaeota archaeon]
MVERERDMNDIFELITKILRASLKSQNNLEKFFQKIVKIGSQYTNANTCVCFLLQEPNEIEGELLKIYAASGEDGDALKNIGANYYIPKKNRVPFINPGEGENKVLKYVKDFLIIKEGYTKEKIKKIEADGYDVLDELRRIGLYLGNAIERMGHNLSELIEERKLPMGITGYVARTGKPIKVNGKEVRKVPEWRGSYEGVHKICTSLIERPLKLKRKTIGLIKIENKKGSEPIDNFNKIRKEKKPCKLYNCFDENDDFILKVLTECAIIAFDNMRFIEETYKKLFGTKLLRKIYDLKPRIQEIADKNGSDLCIKIHNTINTFYDPIKIRIDDYFSLDEISKKVLATENELASRLKLIFVKDIINNITSRYEDLLGTLVKYREHFIHQFQVFLLGYCIINKSKIVQEIILHHLKNKDENFCIDHALKVWFLTSCFHDYSYSFVKMDKWLNNYLEQIGIDYEQNIDWETVLKKTNPEFTELVNVLCKKASEPDEKTFRDKLEKSIKDDQDHGIMSALLLMVKLKREEDLNPKLYEIVCEALAFHTITIPSKGQNTKFKFKDLNILDSPFAFLLVLCDNIQEWGRIEMMNKKIEYDIKLKEIDIINGTDNTEISEKINIKLYYKNFNMDNIPLICEKMNHHAKFWFTIPNLNFNIRLYHKGGRFDEITYKADKTKNIDFIIKNIKEST